MSAREREKEKPRTIGRYVLFQEVAHGGMATVHIGRLRGPAGFARTVAIKRLHPPFARDPEFVSMFLDEARLAARIQHPNVVSVLDVVAADGELFLVMDYIHGESLNTLVRLAGKHNVAMPRRVLAAIIVGVLTGLEAAHEARNERGDPLEIVHRDVSPQNVLLGLDGVPRILDFGVAKAALRVHWSTQSGQIRGKLGYMSPEQLTTGLVDRRSDVYSVGVMLWEGLTGRRLFDPKTAPDVGVIVSRVLACDIEPPSKLMPTTPKPLDAIVLKALARSREDRFASAREMAAALSKAVPPVPPTEVGLWVETVAGGSLKERSAELNAIESAELPGRTFPSDFPGVRARGEAQGDVDEDRESSSVQGGPGGRRPRAELKSGLDLEALIPKAAAGPSYERPPLGPPAQAPVRVEAPALTSSAAVEAPVDDETYVAGVPRSPRRLLWAFAGAVGVLLFGTMLLMRATFATVSKLPDTQATAATSASAPATATQAPAAPPALPTQSSTPHSIPAVSAPVAPASAPAATSPEPSSPAPDTPARHPSAHPATSPRKTNCDPPFTIDAQGVRVPKRECFR